MLAKIDRRGLPLRESTIDGLGQKIAITQPCNGAGNRCAIVRHRQRWDGVCLFIGHTGTPATMEISSNGKTANELIFRRASDAFTRAIAAGAICVSVGDPW